MSDRLDNLIQQRIEAHVPLAALRPQYEKKLRKHPEYWRF